MKVSMIALLIALSSTAVLANGDPEPPSPPEKPEPPKEPPPPTERPNFGDDSGSDYPQSTYLPCCIQDGKMVTKKWWPMRPEKVMKLCERERDRGSAYIFECEVGGEEAVK